MAAAMLASRSPITMQARRQAQTLAAFDGWHATTWICNTRQRYNTPPFQKRRRPDYVKFASAVKMQPLPIAENGV